MLQPIKLESLRELVAAGSVKSAMILGQKGGYAVLASIGVQQRPLGTKFGEVRMFGSTDTAVKVMREIGVYQFNIDITHFEAGRLRAARPDVTAKAKSAATALAHDRWFREQVTAAIGKDKRGEAIWHEHDAMWDELESQAAELVAAKVERETIEAAKPARRRSTPGRRG